jgi:16S rRNA (guanine(966)-N(2))-methyltransferase RsmD
MRIVAGRFGGRRLVAPRGNSTRPTSDRVREALFSVLGSVDEARVLDLYAGTGALALEAVSRGAALAVCVDRDRAALAALAENVASLGVGDVVTVVAAPIERAAARLRQLGPFDLVFVDPPYADVDRAAATLATLAADGVFSEGARVVLEHARRDEPTIAGFADPARRFYGDTALSLFTRASDASAPA